MLIHSFNQFHPAGHGTFFSGLLRADKLNTPRQNFLWIYDCGSNRHTNLPMMVDFVKQQSYAKRVGLLCVSHFDRDHVKGMKEVLGKFKVDVLALPYLPFDQRLEIAFDLSQTDAASVDAVLFALDPIGYLGRIGLIEKVNRVVLIKGGPEAAEPGNENPLESNDPNEPDGPDREMALDLSGESIDLTEYGALLKQNKGGSSLKLQTISHSVVAGVTGTSWEFVFYNKDLPKGKTPRLNATINDVQDALRNIIDSNDPYADPVGFFGKLRKCYVKYFGDSSKGRNDISLCVLSRSRLTSKAVSSCSMFHLPDYPLQVAYTLIPVSNEAGAGLLLCGDISINKAEVQKMRKHFGDERWNDIYVMQIPHHGSQHSWESGVAKACAHEFSVLCVPNFDAAGHHPHCDVMEDIDAKNPVRADYATSVVFAFHKDAV